MRNHRANAHRNERGRKFHAHQQSQITRIAVRPEIEAEIMSKELDKVLANDRLFAINTNGLYERTQKGQSWNADNVYRTIVARALHRAGYTIRLAGRMMVAAGMTPVI